MTGLEEFGAIDVETLAATAFKPDVTRPNGTSIVLLAEYQGKRALLGADAHVDRVVTSIKKLLKGRKRLHIDLFKVSHHGSEGNISKELVQLMDCPLYLISTNGAYFQHPKTVALSRILQFSGHDVTIAFNYRSKFTSVWDRQPLKAKYHFSTIYPPKSRNGTLTVKLAE